MSNRTKTDDAKVIKLDAKREQSPPLDEGVTLDDFHAYAPGHSYIFAPTREPWPASSVNSRLPWIPRPDGKLQSPAGWLDKNKSVEQMTWAPGLPELIADRLIADGGWIERNGVTCFNLYRPPIAMRGNADEAEPWLYHVRKVFPTDADHIVWWLAHRVQRPQDKINHALVLGGAQGIGKDTILAPVKDAIGSWNFAEVSPTQILGRFNGFLKSVILRVSEARDLGEFDRFQFYEHIKPITAAPPDVLRIDEKYLREHYILNCCGVIITTNYKTNGIYLPSDDRRHYVAWSDYVKEDFPKDYWDQLWGWYGNGGIGHVAAYLSTLDLSAFNAKAPPPQTAAFRAIVDANRPPEDAELADVLDALGNPPAVTLDRIAVKSTGEFALWINDRKNRRAIPHRLEACCYVPVHNDSAKDGYWVINSKRQPVYAKKSLPLVEQIKAAQELVNR